DGGVEFRRASARLVKLIGHLLELLQHAPDRPRTRARVEQPFAQMSTAREQRLGALAQTLMVEPQHVPKERFVEASQERREYALVERLVVAIEQRVLRTLAPHHVELSSRLVQEQARHAQLRHVVQMRVGGARWNAVQE